MMKLKRTVVLLLAMLLICNCAAVPAMAAKAEDVKFTEVDEIVYAKGNVNVRTGPGTEHEVITTLHSGQAIRRIGVGDNGWSRVSYMGKPAYMYTSLLTTTEPGTVSGTGNAGTDPLERQIAIAKGLKEWEYTKESWKAVADALKAAQKLENSKNTEKRKAAADTLEKALASLVSMDYTGLEEAIAEAKEQIGSYEVYDLVDRLREAVTKAEQLRFSGDQTQVDATAGMIRTFLEELEELREQNTVVQNVIQEVEVEVPPTSDFCNISQHRIWPVAFAASVVMNVILVLLLPIVIQKRKYKADDVPLVDYDIDDDI